MTRPLAISKERSTIRLMGTEQWPWTLYGPGGRSEVLITRGCADIAAEQLLREDKVGTDRPVATRCRILGVWLRAHGLRGRFPTRSRCAAVKDGSTKAFVALTCPHRGWNRRAAVRSVRLLTAPSPRGDAVQLL